jgi:predicted RecB family nuclease
MEKHGDGMLLSASDLVGHLNCDHLTSLDIAVANSTLAKPASWDPLLELLWARGAQHEQGFVDHLRAQGFEVTVIEGIGVGDDVIASTQDAMRRGDPIIVQAAFRVNDWVGRTDVLRRIEVPSNLGAWSYEVIDTKLARETKAGTVLQLCVYAALLEASQGLRPEHCYVVAPWSGYEPQVYRMDDYAAYYRRVRQAMESAVAAQTTGQTYPDPKEHCDVCRWQERCDERRRADPGGGGAEPATGPGAAAGTPAGKTSPPISITAAVATRNIANAVFTLLFFTNKPRRDMGSSYPFR